VAIVLGVQQDTGGQKRKFSSQGKKKRQRKGPKGGKGSAAVDVDITGRQAGKTGEDVTVQ